MSSARLEGLWDDAYLAEVGADTPVVFPLGEIPPRDRAIMERCWRRNDLARYLQRWDDAYVPGLPEALWSYEWRGCDVGCGFGLYVIEESEKHPQRAYVGIDKGTRRGGRLARHCEALDRPNLFALHGDAVPLLAAMPDASFEQLSILYPNPWWQPKHRQKRWAYHAIFPKMLSLLKPGGELLLCSNEDFYLREWYFALTHHPDAADTLEEVYVGPIRSTEGRTHFEVKYIAAGVACGEICFRRDA